MSEKMSSIIRRRVGRKGFLPFSQYMNMVLYTPEYGYYSGVRHPFGARGDFVTAPILTPLFGQTLAVQVAEILSQTDAVVYEFGAGSGKLAVDLLSALGDQVRQYCIIEVSASLRAAQQALIKEKLPEALSRVCWLEQMPNHFDGVIIANEVLDAMPVEVVSYRNGRWFQCGVSCDAAGRLVSGERPLCGTLVEHAARWLPEIEGYTSELHLWQQAFVSTVCSRLERGGMILVDYGFDSAQYYHPQRSEGTLIGHYRHHSIHDPLFWPGLTDLTAHVNFTAVADAAVAAGVDLAGYATQANFLINLGLVQCIERIAEPASPDFIRAVSAVQVLTAPHEMGEMFKVMGLAKNIRTEWQGFSHGNMVYKL